MKCNQLRRCSHSKLSIISQSYSIVQRNVRTAFLQGLLSTTFFAFSSIEFPIREKGGRRKKKEGRRWIDLDTILRQEGRKEGRMWRDLFRDLFFLRSSRNFFLRLTRRKWREEEEKKTGKEEGKNRNDIVRVKNIKSIEGREVNAPRYWKGERGWRRGKLHVSLESESWKEINLARALISFHTPGPSCWWPGSDTDNPIWIRVMARSPSVNDILRNR